MLLYNQRKEFIGIDEDDLSALDFKNLNELQNESNDFADLFVKKPGYIHNFKNFSWIDFILHSETDESKAIIHAKGSNYSCALHITPFHFTDKDSGYAVSIRNLRALKGAENAQASKDLEASGGVKSSPSVSTQTSSSVPAPSSEQKNMPELDISLDDIKLPTQTPQSFEEVPSSLEAGFNSSEPELELPNFEQSYTQELNEPDLLDIPEPQNFNSGVNEFGAPVDIDYNAPLDLDMDVMKDSFEEPVYEPETPVPTDSLAIQESTKSETPMLGDYVSSAGQEFLSDLVKSGTYQYDPSVAANELGLPVDLIEEFIGDFIEQAHEFHDDLYASVNADDFDNVQILSHKLKGVAANLRVEDAFDVLSVVNVSKDVEEILPNLNAFYKIIAKLEGKEIPVEVPAPIAEALAEPEAAQEISAPIEEEIDYNFGIKQPEEGPLLIDEEVLAQDTDDDIYGDLLGSSDDFMQEEIPAPAESSFDAEEDIYGDLLGTSQYEEPSFQETESHLEEASAPSYDDDLYDDLLGAPEFETAPEVQSSPSVEVPALNFDAQRSANELGIPLDIVKDFVQDFKEQLRTHQNDFNNAITNSSIKEINKTATLLKGMSDNLRLNEISEVLKGLQAEKDINNTTQALATLQAYADQL